EISKENILQALKNGNSYLVNYKVGNPYNFYAGISANGKSAVFGEKIQFQEEMKFYLKKVSFLLKLPEITGWKSRASAEVGFIQIIFMWNNSSA
ncbi:MAG: hypothetical protein B6D62_04490, partial [Candidatus Cloacimonas sp. 4484_275]